MTAHKLVKLAYPADAARLQQFLERCSDYYELHEGWATPQDAGEYELTGVPPGASTDDLHVLALEDDDGTLLAVAQLLRNFPEPGTWWLGLLVVAPELRSRGLGSELLRHVIDAVTADGASDLRLAVSVHNPRAERFWEAAGFRQTGKTVPVTARSGHVDMGRILSRP